MNGVVRAKGEVHVGKELAISPGQVYGELEGEKTTDPAFGLEAVWIDHLKEITLEHLVIL